MLSSKRILGNSIKKTTYFASADTTESIRTGDFTSGATNPLQSRVVTGQLWGGGLGSGMSGISYTSPGFYSPPHTPSSWQIPTTRTEVYKWCAFFLNNEPRVATGIDFYSNFPINNFELNCPNASVREYFEKLVKKLNLQFHLPKILIEYFGMGDAFVMMEIDC